MRKLIDLVKNPSGFDSLDNYMGDIPETKWCVVLTRSRDADLLTESNFQCAITELGGEVEDKVEIFRFGHWACGWWEALCVVEGTKEHETALNIIKKLENYPVLDDDDFSERENDEAQSIWSQCYDKQERLEYIRNNRDQFYFSNFKDLMDNVNGKYFSGYASELIG